jgi:hypothetical protein
MKTQIRTRKALVYTSLLLLAGVAACKAVWNFEAEGELLGAKGRLKANYDGRDIALEEVPNDEAVDMEFVDEDGNAVPPGASGVNEGDKVTPPDGATTVIITGPSDNQGGCVGCSAMLDLGHDPEEVQVAHVEYDEDAPVAAMAGLGAAEPQRTPHQQTGSTGPVPFFKDRYIEVRTFIPDYAGTSALQNVIFHADVRVPSNFDALDIYELVKPALLNGPGSFLPSNPSGINVEVERFNRFVPNGRIRLAPNPDPLGGPIPFVPIRLGGMKVFAFDKTNTFTEFDLNVNGTQVATSAILSTGQHYAAPNGWRVVEANVPDNVLNYDATSAWIQLDLITKTPEDPLNLELHYYAATWE